MHSVKPAVGSEEEALQAFTIELQPALIRYFSRRIDAHDEIPDLVNDVFVRLLRRGGVASMDRARGYVFETAHSVLMDWFRRRRSHCRDYHEPFDPYLHGGTDVGVDHVLVKEEELDILAQALMELPERTRAIFLLRRVKGMKYRDIAERLAISVRTAETHMKHALVRLTKRLKED